jgi:hypothetical protein
VLASPLCANARRAITGRYCERPAARLGRRSREGWPICNRALALATPQRPNPCRPLPRDLRPSDTVWLRCASSKYREYVLVGAPRRRFQLLRVARSGKPIVALGKGSTLSESPFFLVVAERLIRSLIQ